MKILAYNCTFKQYGEEERKCSKCGYTIGGSGDIIKQLEFLIGDDENQIPNCGILIDNNETFANSLINNGSDFFNKFDLLEYLELKEIHDKEFNEWCKENKYVGPDDILDNEIIWLGKSINFLIKKGYINEK